MNYLTWRNISRLLFVSMRGDLDLKYASYFSSAPLRPDPSSTLYAHRQEQLIELDKIKTTYQKGDLLPDISVINDIVVNLSLCLLIKEVGHLFSGRNKKSVDGITCRWFADKSTQDLSELFANLIEGIMTSQCSRYWKLLTFLDRHLYGHKSSVTIDELRKQKIRLQRLWEIVRKETELPENHVSAIGKEYVPQVLGKNTLFTNTNIFPGLRYKHILRNLQARVQKNSLLAMHLEYIASCILYVLDQKD